MTEFPFLSSISIQKSPEVFHAKSWGINWGKELIDELKKVASNSNLNRARLCFHPYTNDLHQEMLIVMKKEVIEKPQMRINGFDSKIVIEGEAKICYYSNDGEIIQEIKLGDNHSKYVHTRSQQFHNLVILSEWFVFLEILNGPFTENTTKFASFSNYKEVK